MNEVLAAFAARAARAPARLVLLDYDGTLAPFRIDRSRAFPYPGVAEAVTRLRDTRDTKVALVSGRPAQEVADLLGLRPPPEIWGCHGWERLRGGVPELLPLPPDLRVAFAAAEEDARGLTAAVERKPVGLALHLRGLAPAEAERQAAAVAAAWRPRLSAGLEIHEFDGGLELRAPQRSKAEVVSDLLSEAAEGTAVAYLGDDRTDEDAFRAVRGKGLGVLVRSHWRPTAAEAWLVPPEGLLEFLRALARTD